jgi:hypothetical protein
MSILRRLFFGRRWWLLALPVVVCLALIAVDNRFAYVALIVAMGIVMIALPFIYYYYGITQESRWSILEKTVTITGDGLLLDFTSDKMNKHVIAWNEVAGTTAINECLIVQLKKNRYTFLAIPLNSFTGKKELREFVLEIKSHISDNQSC